MIPAPCQIRRNQSQRPCSKKAQLVLGILLIITASTTFIFGIVSVSLPTLYYGYGGNPLWTGVIILTSGILCVCSSRTSSKCTVTSGLVMSIISIVFAIDQILWMSAAAANEYYGNENCGYNYYNSYNYDDCEAEVAIDSVLIALGVIELGLAIAAVCVLSVDICCPRTRNAMQATYQVGQPLILQGGFSQSGAPGYPPQTHFVTQAGQMYVHQTPVAYPTVQYATGQPQQLPTGQLQQYPVVGGQPQQYATGGQAQQLYTTDGQAQAQYPTGGQAQQAGGQAEQGINPFNPPAYNEKQ